MIYKTSYRWKNAVGEHRKRLCTGILFSGCRAFLYSFMPHIRVPPDAISFFIFLRILRYQSFQMRSTTKMYIKNPPQHLKNARRIPGSTAASSATALLYTDGWRCRPHVPPPSAIHKSNTFHCPHPRGPRGKFESAQPRPLFPGYCITVQKRKAQKAVEAISIILCKKNFNCIIFSGLRLFCCTVYQRRAIGRKDAPVKTAFRNG